MKKGVYNLLIFLVILLVATLIVLTISAQQQTSTNEPSYENGKNIEKEFLNKPQAVRDNIIKRDIDGFIQGLEDSPDIDKFFESWFEYEQKNNRYFIKDEDKTILFKKLVKKNPEYALKIAQKALEKIKTKTPETYTKYYRDTIQKFKIDEGSLEKLKWKGNVLLIPNEKGDMKAFIDFDNPPKFLKEIEIKKEGDKNLFRIISDDGIAPKEILFDSGGLTPDLTILKPDGSVLGSTTLKSAFWNNDEKKLTITYTGINGKEKKLDIGEDRLKGDEIKKILKLFKDKTLLEFTQKVSKGKKVSLDDIKEVIENAETKTAIENILKKIGNKNINFPTANSVNLGYRRADKTPKSETILFSFNEDGELNIKASNDATVISTDIKGEPGILFNHYQHPNLEKHQTELLFNKHGELIAHKATEGIIFDEKGYESIAFKSGKEMIGTRIMRSSIADAIANGDLSKALALFESDSKFFERTAGQGKVDFQVEALKLLKKQLENENLNTELRNRILDAVDIVQKNLEKSAENMLDSFFQGRKNREKLLNNLNVGFLLDRTEEQTKQAIASLTDLENLDTLMNYYKNPENQVYANEFNALLGKTLGDYVDGYTDVLKSSIAEQIADKIGGLSEEVDVKGFIEKWIKSQDFSQFIKKQSTSTGTGSNPSFSQTIKSGFRDYLMNELDNELIEKYPLEDMFDNPKIRDTISGLITDFDKKELIGIILPKDERTKIVDAFGSLIDEIDSKVKDEKTKFWDAIKSDFSQTKRIDPNHNFDTYLLIDTELGEVVYTGNKRAEIDTKIPLTSVRVNHKGSKGDKGNVFVLKNNEEWITWIDGKNTYAKRRGNHNMVDINSIVNENAPGKKEFTLVTSGDRYNLYDLTNPSRFSKKRHYGYGSIVGVPLLGSIPVLTTKMEIQKTPGIKDIGADPNAKITITNIAQGIRGGLFGRLINRIVTRKAGQKPQDLSEMTSEIYAELDVKAKNAIKQSGGRSKLKTEIQQGREMLDFLDEIDQSDYISAKIPNAHKTAFEDTLYFGELIANDPTNQALKNEFAPVVNWLSQQKLYQWQSIVFENNGITISGRKFTNANPAVFRMLMRDMSEDPGKITEYRYFDMQGNEIK